MINGYTTEMPTATPLVAEALTDGDGPTVGRVTYTAHVTDMRAEIPVVKFGTAGMIGTTRGGPLTVTITLIPEGAIHDIRGKRVRIEVIDDEPG